MFVINFYGSPGAGKSTLAAELFVKLKKLGYKCELLSEYAKDLVYEDRSKTLADQLYVFAKMNHKLHMLAESGTEFIISDSPLLLSILYKKYRNVCSYIPDQLWTDFVTTVNNAYPHINFFVTKDTTFVHENFGRIDDEKSAEKIYELLIKMLTELKESYIRIINTKDFDINQILNELKNKGVI